MRHRGLAVLTFNVLGVINWQLRWYRPDGPLSFDEVADEIVHLILYGVLGDPSGDRKSEALLFSPVKEGVWARNFKSTGREEA